MTMMMMIMMMTIMMNKGRSTGFQAIHDEMSEVVSFITGNNYG